MESFIIQLQSLLHHSFLSRCSSTGFGFVPYFLYSLPGSWCLNSVLTAFSLSIERCSVYLGFWTVMVFVLFWCNF
ncbi:unnamed protein product [Brassica oleracea]